MSRITIETLIDPDARAAALPDLARLRIAIFRDWPYLYEGSLDYEQRYLAGFEAEPHSILVIARDGKRIIGAATASPMNSQTPEIRAPMEQAGFDTASLFYFGESVLLPRYHGQSIGHGFFDHREDAAKQAGAQAACYCAVVRPPNHPRHPAEVRDLAPFWRVRGYSAVPGAITSLSWRDIDDIEETDHPMQFWARRL